ncbi:MAG: SipW-dependent-type signal peptide-containing protein [Anaerovoracaceae bacterium]
MKTGKKVFTLALCAVLLVVASVGLTVAYLTSTDDVTNTFTVGSVAITLDEAKVDVYGVADTATARVKENTYKLIPGHTYTKDPTIHVGATSEDCWLFVKVENDILNIEAAGDTTIASQLATNGWSSVSGATNVYAYRTTVSAQTDVHVFRSFKLSGDADVSGYGTATVKVTAYAVQADGFSTAAAAWTAAAFS